MWNLKRNDTNEFSNKLETDSENELIVAINCWDGEGWRKGIVREFVWSEVKSLSRGRLCDPMDCSPPGSSIHGIFQARVLEWVAISFSRGSSRPRDRTRVSCIAGRCFYRLSHQFVYTAIFKMDNQQGSATAHGTQLSVIWQPGWEGSLGANGHLYMYGWVPLLFT